MKSSGCGLRKFVIEAAYDCTRSMPCAASSSSFSRSDVSRVGAWSGAKNSRGCGSNVITHDGTPGRARPRAASPAWPGGRDARRRNCRWSARRECPQRPGCCEECAYNQAKSLNCSVFYCGGSRRAASQDAAAKVRGSACDGCAFLCCGKDFAEHDHRGARDARRRNPRQIGKRERNTALLRQGGVFHDHHRRRGRTPRAASMSAIARLPCPHVDRRGVGRSGTRRPIVIALSHAHPRSDET